MIRLFRLKIKDIPIFLEAGLFLFFFKLALLFIRFKYIARFLGVRGQESGSMPEEKKTAVIKRVSRAIIVVSSHAPWRTKCFAQALAARAMLKLRKIRSTIYFGLRRDDDGKLHAHSWLKSGQHLVIGGKNCGSFSVIAFFGDK